MVCFVGVGGGRRGREGIGGRGSISAGFSPVRGFGLERPSPAHDHMYVRVFGLLLVSFLQAARGLAILSKEVVLGRLWIFARLGIGVRFSVSCRAVLFLFFFSSGISCFGA